MRRRGSVRAARCLWVRPAASVASYCSHVGWCPLPLFCSKNQRAVGPERGLDGLPSLCRAAHSGSSGVAAQRSPGAAVFSISVPPPTRPNLQPPAPPLPSSSLARLCSGSFPQKCASREQKVGPWSRPRSWVPWGSLCTFCLPETWLLPHPCSG